MFESRIKRGFIAFGELRESKQSIYSELSGLFKRACLPISHQYTLRRGELGSKYRKFVHSRFESRLREDTFDFFSLQYSSENSKILSMDHSIQASYLPLSSLKYLLVEIEDEILDNEFQMHILKLMTECITIQSGFAMELPIGSGTEFEYCGVCSGNVSGDRLETLNRRSSRMSSVIKSGGVMTSDAFQITILTKHQINVSMQSGVDIIQRIQESRYLGSIEELNDCYIWRIQDAELSYAKHLLIEANLMLSVG